MLRTLRLCYSQSSSIVAASRITFFVQNPILRRHLSSEISEIQPNFTINYLINSCGLSPKGAISASKWFELQSPERADSVLSFLRTHGFSEIQISKILRSCTQLLNSNPEKTLLPKLEFFRSNGVSMEGLGKLLANYPRILSVSLEKQIVPTYNFLRSMISEKNAVSVLSRGSWFIYSKNLVPNLELLRESGMPPSCISLLLARQPTAFALKPKLLGEVVDRVAQMGFNMQTSTSVHAMCVLLLRFNDSNSVWNRSCEVYKRWGWSEDDVLSAFRRYPYCMNKSETKIASVMDFLVNKMGWPQTSIVKYPTVMGLSMESRIIPRCSVVKVLVLKGLIKEIENVSLSSLLAPAEKCFLDKFVFRYIDEVPQLLSVYEGKVEIQDV
ncbi:unnamed protein product [Malus baccata var. baccata]